MAALCLHALPLLAQGTVSAGSVNGVLNPLYFSGTDIGAQINTAWESGLGKTVRVPPGSYTFTTTIAHPGAGYSLECDSGTTLIYNGSSDAMLLPAANGSGTEGATINGLGGCLLKGNSSAQSGIHILAAINQVYVRNMRITGFTNGYGIFDTGGNTVGISGMTITANKTGIYLTGSSFGSSYAAEAVRIYDNTIASNTSLGIDSENSHTPAGKNKGLFILGNVITGNGAGGIGLNWEYSTTVADNFLRNSTFNIGLDDTNQNVYEVSVVRNYFDSSSTTESILVGPGFNYHFEDNVEVGRSGTTCFMNEIGSTGGLRGIGTNYISSGSNEFCKNGSPSTTP